MGLLDPHLDDGEFARVWTDRLTQGLSGPGGAAERHLLACADCRTRYDAFAGWLGDLREDARADAEAGLTSERLLAQQAQILRRLEVLEQPARVIAFPRFARPIGAPPKQRSRWIAAAAAAGLAAGLGLGQLMNLPGSLPAELPDAQIVLAPPDGRVGGQPLVLVSDEMFFDDQDLVPSQARVPESLQYLNLITPSARDYDPR